MTTKLVQEAIEEYPNLFDYTFKPRYWSDECEDLVWCDCIEDDTLSGWIFYLFLEDWSIDHNE